MKVPFTTFALLLLIAAFYPQMGKSQESCGLSIIGRVYDANSKEPLPLAALTLTQSDKKAVSTPNGTFRIDHICPGETCIWVHYLGYRTDSVILNLQQNTEVSIYLEPDIQLLEAVEVAGKRETTPAGQTVSALSGQALQAQMGKTLGELLKAIDGVTALQTGPTISKPVIHGLYGNRILLLNNGIRQEGQQWGTEHAPEIDPFVASEIKVVKGAGTVRYGADALGGVILIEPGALPTQNGLAGQANTMYFSNGNGVVLSGSLENTLPNWKGAGWRVQATAKAAGDSRAPSYVLSNTGVRELNFSTAFGVVRERSSIQAYISHFSTELGILSSAHIGNLTDLQRALSSDRPLIIRPFSYQIDNPKQQVAHTLLKINGMWKIGTGKFSWQYGGQRNGRQEFDRRRGNRDHIPSLDLELFTHSLDIVYERPTGKNGMATVGLSSLYQDNNNVPGTGVRPLVPNYNSSTAGLFAIQKWAGNRWELEAGARYDFRYLQVLRFDRENQLQKPDFQFHNATFSLGGAWFPAKGWAVRTHLGSAWRPPNVYEMFSHGLHHGVAAIEEGNPDLRTERSLKWIQSLNYSSERVSGEISAYYNAIQDYIYLDPQAEPALTIRGAFPVFRHHQADARIMGTDASIAVQITPSWAWNGRASIIRARNQTTNGSLPFIPSDRYQTGLIWEKEAIGPFQKLRIMGSGQWVLRQTRADDIRDFAPPPNGYFLLSSHVSAAVGPPAKQLTFQLGADNLLNTTYREYMNRMRYYTDDLGRNIYLRVQYQFK